MLSKRFYGAALMVVICAVPILNACSSSSSNPLCCTEFKVGATVDANVGGSAQSKVALQAVADLGGIAAAAVEDLTGACRGIAQDLDAPADKQTAADALEGTDKMKAWCDLVFASGGVFATAKAQAGGTIAIKFVPPQCNVSVSAQAQCQGSCDVSGKCDIKANPPTCTGGKLEVECKGTCMASGSAALSCTGQCSGNCSGSCQAEGGVECKGKCDGACSVATDSGGNCNGTCKGTCSVTAPNVQCMGSCSGTCSASCMGSAMASVKCDGTCMGDYQPISCTGGKLEGGCKVDAHCQANCNASAQAKADCSPPEVTVVVEGSANAELAGKLVATLKAHLPALLALNAKFSIAGDLAGQLAANVNADVVADIKPACIPVVVEAVASAGKDFSASLSAVGQISSSVGSGG